MEPWFVSEPVTKCSICYVNLLGLGGGAADLIEPMCSWGRGEGTLVRYNKQVLRIYGCVVRATLVRYTWLVLQGLHTKRGHISALY